MRGQFANHGNQDLPESVLYSIDQEDWCDEMDRELEARRYFNPEEAALELVEREPDA